MIWKFVAEALEGDTPDREIGTIRRFRRVRKWMLIDAAAILLLSNNWINYQAVVIFLKLERLPQAVVLAGLVGWGAVLLLQAGLFAQQRLINHAAVARRHMGALTESPTKDHYEAAVAEQQSIFVQMETSLGKHEQVLQNIEKNFPAAAHSRAITEASQSYEKIAAALEQRLSQANSHISAWHDRRMKETHVASRVAKVESFWDFFSIAYPFVVLFCAIASGVHTAIDPLPLPS